MQFWSPHLKKEIMELKKAQIRSSMMAKGREGLPCRDRSKQNKQKPFKMKRDITAVRGVSVGGLGVHTTGTVSLKLLNIKR